MKTRPLTAVLVALASGPAGCRAPTGDATMTTTGSFDRTSAQRRLEHHLSTLPLLVGAEIAPMPDYDIAGLHAFAALPRCRGAAGARARCTTSLGRARSSCRGTRATSP